MFYNLKISFRNLLRNRLYSSINIIGLAVSLAACIFVVLWVRDEKSYDRFHPAAENIYMGIAHFKSEGSSRATNITSGIFVRAATDNFGEVESFCRTRESSAAYLQCGGIKTGEKTILFADSTFFTFFNFPIIDGPSQDLLQKTNEAVISHRLAHELFGNDEAVGKTFNIEDRTCRVAAVMANFPTNTSLPQSDIVLSHQSEPFEFYLELLDGWGSCEFLSFLRLRNGADHKKIARETTAMQPSKLMESRSFTLQPLVNMHLYTLEGEPAGIKTVQLFQWIALIMLCIACINYVNIVTARSVRRTHEITLRKTLGARIHQLIRLLILEAGILFVVAMALAIILNVMLLPTYNYLSGKETAINWFDGTIWITYGAMLLFVVLAAGLYPAWKLSSFNPSQGLRNKNGGVLFRRVLVITQFVASISLIIGTVAIISQLNYIRNKNLGYDKEYVFTVQLHKMAEHYEAVKTELLRNTAINGVTTASMDITDALSTNQCSNWQGKTDDGGFSHYQVWADSSFFDVMRIPFADGHSFTSLTESQLVINETAVAAMGMDNPVGKWMETRGGMRGTIVGVAKDFHFKNLYSKINPMVIYSASHGWNMYLRTTAQQASQAIAAVEKLWKQYNPDYPFTYNFLDEKFDRMYRADECTGSLFIVFSVIAILISCLGLFGLVTFTAETKTKEIGIRKVLGASVSSIVKMLSKEFLMLVGIAMLIAFPLAYFWLDKMLQDYAYRINIAWWMFALAAVIAIILTLLTVGWRAIKAATANPVKSIKTE